MTLMVVTMAGCVSECQGIHINAGSRFLQSQAELDCNVVGSLFADHCPACQFLPLNNSTFGFGLGEDRAPWRGDRARIVEGDTENITPCYANRMLRFEASYATDSNNQDVASTSYQVIDVRETSFTESVTFVARALVNRRQVDSETDRAFRLHLTAYTGDPATFEPNSTNHQQIAGNTNTLTADPETDTWEALFTELTAPATNIDFLVVGIAAVEDVVDDRGSVPEFDAHFVDQVYVGYVNTGYDLSLQSNVVPKVVSMNNSVILSFTLTNHSSGTVHRPQVATPFHARRLNAHWQLVPNQPLPRYTLRMAYRRHHGDGVFDPDTGIWQLDQVQGDRQARLYVVAEPHSFNPQPGLSAIPKWPLTSALLPSPGEQNTDNNSSTSSLSYASISYETPSFADTTTTAGDTLDVLLLTTTASSALDFQHTLSNPTLASVSFREESAGVSQSHHYMQIIGQTPGTGLVSVFASVGSTIYSADFFELTVTSATAPPIANDDTYLVEAGQPLTVQAPGILNNDSAPAGNRLTARLETPPTTGTLTLNLAGGFTYVPDDGFTGDAFTYRAADGAGDDVPVSDPATVTLTLSQPNRPPVAVADTFEVAPNTGTVLDVLANDSDPDGDAITVIASSPRTVESGSTEVFDGGQTVRYTPEAGFTGTDLFYYVIVDSLGLTSTETPVTVTVANANRPPAVSAPINDLTVSPDPPTSCSFDLDDHFADPDGDALAYSARSSGGNATVTINGSTVTVNGSGLTQAMVTISAEDPEGFTVSDTFVLQKVLSVTDCGGNRLTR